MVSLAYRTLSLLLRFACPLLILWFSSSKVLGQYYLFNAFYTFCVFVISLEMAVPFSHCFLRTRSVFGKKIVFSVFIRNLLILGLVLSAPLIIFNYWTGSFRGTNALLMILVVATGGCVNEAGRFFWNVGYVKEASRRELLCSIVFVIAVISSVVFSGEAIGPVFFQILIFFNLAMIFAELKTHGSLHRIQPNLDFKKAKRNFRRCYQSIKKAAPQVVHVQILSFYPFLERLFLEKKEGLEIVGSYSFGASLIQSGLGLLLTPKIFRVRKQILLAESENQKTDAAGRALRLLGLEAFVVFATSLPIYLLVPWFNKVTHKGITTNLPMLLAAALSTLALSYSNAISPFFASGERFVRSNLTTLLLMCPFIVGLMFLSAFDGPPFCSTIGLLSFCAFLQLVIRFVFCLNFLFRTRIGSG